MLNTVIFDNTVFNYFLRIRKINLEIIVRSLIIKVIIPSQIACEMERLAENEPSFRPKIMKWIDLSIRNSYYHYCNTYDSIIFDNARKYLDIGEAGAIAQAEKIKVVWFISDDTKNSSFISQNYPFLKQRSIFFLIALADIESLLPDYEAVLLDVLEIRKYHDFSPRKKRELKALIRGDYIDALKLKGLIYNRKIVSQKTSIDTIIKKKRNELHNY